MTKRDGVQQDPPDESDNALVRGVLDGTRNHGELFLRLQSPDLVREAKGWIRHRLPGWIDESGDQLLVLAQNALAAFASPRLATYHESFVRSGLSLRSYLFRGRNTNFQRLVERELAVDHPLRVHQRAWGSCSRNLYNWLRTDQPSPRGVEFEQSAAGDGSTEWSPRSRPLQQRGEQASEGRRIWWLAWGAAPETCTIEARHVDRENAMLAEARRRGLMEGAVPEAGPPGWARRLEGVFASLDGVNCFPLRRDVVIGCATAHLGRTWKPTGGFTRLEQLGDDRVEEGRTGIRRIGAKRPD